MDDGFAHRRKFLLARSESNVTETVSINQTIIDFLTYYTSADRQLDYAVLLDGPWGAGKTHLIRAFLDSHKTSGRKYLYVSLYGMTSVKQIEDEFYRLLHPVLSSKGMRIASVLVRGAAKGLLKIDISGKETAESINLTVPEINLADYLKGPAEQLLVFDDLERCMMPVTDVLGYINAFVEHDGMKVILLANEEEVTKKDERFPTIKEKLIGQTLRVRSDVDAAYPEFLRTISSEKVRQFLESERDHVLVIHAQSETNNLRILKQALWDFERISLLIPDEDWKNSEAVLKMLKLILAMSMEVRAGRMGPEHLGTLMGSSFVRYMRKRNNEAPGFQEQFEKRYSDVSLTDPVFRPDVLGRIIIEGLSDVDLIKKTLGESRYFAKPTDVPAWRRAWYGFESDDVAYEAAVAEVEKQFAARSERDPAVLYHMFGILLRASDIGALTKTRAEILLDGKAYVDEIARDGKILASVERSGEVNALRGSSGLGFTEENSSEFNEFVKYYLGASNRASEASYATRARALLDRAKKEPQEFLFDLCVNNVRASPYYETPLLAALPPSEFVTKVVSLPAQGQISVFSMFKGRYEFNRLENVLAPEKPWLAEVRSLLLEAMCSARPMTRSRILAMIASDLDPFVSVSLPDAQNETVAEKPQ